VVDRVPANKRLAASLQAKVCREMKVFGEEHHFEGRSLLSSHHSLVLLARRSLCRACTRGDSLRNRLQDALELLLLGHRRFLVCGCAEIEMPLRWR
jgi:hypothetical protein